MTSRQVEQRRTASESVSLPALTAQALAAVQAAGLDFESLELNAGFRRKPRQAHLWYVADTGVGRNGQPWLMVTAGNAKITGDVSTPLVVYKSWEAGGATIDPAEVADIHRQTEGAARRRKELERVREKVASKTEQSDVRARLAELEKEQDRLIVRVDELKLKDLQNWREEEIEKSGLMGLWDALAQQAEKLAERIDR